MAGLTSKQRALLKSMAHGLKPVVHIGKEGVTDETLHAVDEVLRTRELIKLKVLEAAPAEAREVANEVEAGIPASSVVQVIGRTIVLYRPDPEEPQIRLP